MAWKQGIQDNITEQSPKQKGENSKTMKTNRTQGVWKLLRKQKEKWWSLHEIIQYARCLFFYNMKWAIKEIAHSKMQNSMQARFAKSLFSVSQKNRFGMT